MGTNQRQSPFFTPASVALTFLVITILAIALWLQGGTAFSPGLVSAKSVQGVELGGFRSHAGFEAQCSLCHQPFQSDQAALCLECHQDIRAQIDRQDGLHGRDPGVWNPGTGAQPSIGREAQPRQCAACHPEHRGRAFDPAQAALASLDHANTRFALAGKHSTLRCQQCHADNPYAAADPDCASCHQEPVLHAGLFGSDCAACHAATGWRPASIGQQPFRHDQTRFSLARHTLDARGAALACTACHSGTTRMSQVGTACLDCHTASDAAFMQKHTQQFDLDCLACHDGVDRLHGFDHQAVFPLTGQHGGLECARCHPNRQYRGTSPRCAACHQEPALHAGFFGLRCDYCHTNQGWRPAPLKNHTFPLDHGGQGEVECKTCHPAGYGENRCDTCHEHAAEPVARAHAALKLAPEELANCLSCHLDGRVSK